MELLETNWILFVVGVVAVSVWILLLWFDNWYCKKTRAGPDWPDTPWWKVVARFFYVNGMVICNFTLPGLAVVTLGHSIPKLLGY